MEADGVKPKDELLLAEAIKVMQARRSARRDARKDRLAKHPGDHYYRKKAYVSALRAYRSELAKPKRAKDVSLIYKIGATYAAMRDFRAAMRWWGKALSLAPKRSILFEHMVLAALKAAENGQLDLGARRSKDRVERASKALNEGQPALALAWLVDPGDEKAVYLRGQAALRGGNLALARACFEKLREGHKEDAAIAAALAKTLVRLRQSTAARQLLDATPSLKGLQDEEILLREDDAIPTSLKTPQPPGDDVPAGDLKVKEPASIAPAKPGKATEPETPKKKVIEGAGTPGPLKIEKKATKAPKAEKTAPKKAAKKQKAKKRAKKKAPKKAKKKAKKKAPKKAKKAKKKAPKKAKKKRMDLEDEDL
jgi:tetratricopeptide (TPR) repeat protein